MVDLRQDQLRALIASAEQIRSMLSGGAEQPKPLVTSTREPRLLPPDLASVLRRLANLHHSTRAQVECALSQSMEKTRLSFLAMYGRTRRRMASLDTQILPDHELEAKLCAMYETAYRRHCLRALDIIQSWAEGTQQADTVRGGPERTGGFSSRTTCILEASFRYTTTPTVADVDRLAQLTGLQTHQFQNKRNRRNKRVTSSSAAEGPTQPPHADGRRVASLPSRARTANTSHNGGRATKPLPKRYVPASRPAEQPSAAAPLERTLSHESDSTNFSYSSIPSNGGFTAPTYPTMPLNPEPAPAPVSGQQPPVNFDQLDLSSLVPDLNLDFDLDALLNSLAPPTDDFAASADFDAQIQAAMRPMEPSTFANLTLAPSPSFSFGSSSSSSPSQGSPLSELDFSQWAPDLSQDEVAAMDMMKVFLQAEAGGLSPASELGPMYGSDGMFEQSKEQPQVIVASRSESPAETIASVALHSGRASPDQSIPTTRDVSPSVITTTTVSVDSTFEFDFDLDFEAMELDSKPPQYHQQGEASGSGWMMGVLPFEMGDSMMEMTA